jgi:hypothetical protein
MDAVIRQHLAQTGRAGLTAQEIRDFELYLRATPMSNAEIRESMATVRFWRERGRQTATVQWSVPKVTEQPPVEEPPREMSNREKLDQGLIRQHKDSRPADGAPGGRS